MAQFSNHLKILLTNPTSKIQEEKLVERPRHVRPSVRKREAGVVQASQPHFTPVLALYDPSRVAKTSADASSFGLRGVLLEKQDDQTWRPVIFISRALTPEWNEGMCK